MLNVNEEEDKSSSSSGRIAFGFDRDKDAQQVHKKKSGFGPSDDKEKQTKELLQATQHLGVELTMVLEMLGETLNDACEMTKVNMQAYTTMTKELGQVVDVDIVTGRKVVEQTMGLSLELQNIDNIQRKVDKLDTALQKYENLANSLLERQRKIYL